MRFLKSLLRWFISAFGREVRDERTGVLLGKALVLACGRHASLIGLHHPYVRPVFLPADRVKYGRQRIGFATHPPVDFPRLAPWLPPAELKGGEVEKLRGSHPSTPPHPSPLATRHSSLDPSSSDLSASQPFSVSAFPPPFLWAILVHQSAEECRSILDYWVNLGFEDILLVHGGNRKDFEKIDFGNAIFVPDENLRTVSHPVEKQSYVGPMREISNWLEGRLHERICLVEYDHLPLVEDWGQRLEELRARENADVLFHHLVRVDGTNAPHYLYHLSAPAFFSAWESISQREDPHTVLNCMATGSFWTREAFTTVAAIRNPKSELPPLDFRPPTSTADSSISASYSPSAIRHPPSAAGRPIYLEMDLPTTAHHLGFRVRDVGAQNEFVSITPFTHVDLESTRSKGAWSLHPVKHLRAQPRTKNFKHARSALPFPTNTPP